MHWTRAQFVPGSILQGRADSARSSRGGGSSWETLDKLGKENRTLIEEHPCVWTSEGTSIGRRENLWGRVEIDSLHVQTSNEIGQTGDVCLKRSALCNELESDALVRPGST